MYQKLVYEKCTYVVNGEPAEPCGATNIAPAAQEKKSERNVERTVELAVETPPHASSSVSFA